MGVRTHFVCLMTVIFGFLLKIYNALLSIDRSHDNSIITLSYHVIITIDSNVYKQDRS